MFIQLKNVSVDLQVLLHLLTVCPLSLKTDYYCLQTICGIFLCVDFFFMFEENSWKTVNSYISISEFHFLNDM